MKTPTSTDRKLGDNEILRFLIVLYKLGLVEERELPFMPQVGMTDWDQALIRSEDLYGVDLSID